MKTLIAIFFLLIMIPAMGYSQTEYKPKYAPRKEDHRNKKDELDRKQGLWKQYNMDGNLMWEIEYLNDRRHGISRRYYANGRVMRETEYQYGIKDGSFKRYDYNGVITEGEYSSGKKINHWINYYGNGQIKSDGFYNNGYRNGDWKYYNRNGQLISIIVFKDGRDVRDILAEEKKANDAKKVALKKTKISSR